MSTLAVKGPYGASTIGVQSNLPVAERRELTPEEQAKINKNLDNWLPTIFTSYGTPAEEMLSSPVKTGALTGVLSGGLLGGLAGLLQAAVTNDFSALTAAVVGGVGALVGLVSGVATGISRSVENSNIIDLMSRLPKGATKRDLLADPLYHAENMVLRAPMIASRGLGDTALTAGLIATLLGDRSR